jgi:hypothetical protein
MQYLALINHPPGLDARSLYMEITCSGHETVRTIGHHRLDTTHFKKEFIEILGQLIAQLSVRTAHDYCSDGAQFLSSQTLI